MQRPNRVTTTITLTGVGLAGIVLLLAVVFASYLLSFPYTLEDEKAAQLIHHHLRYEAAQRVAALYKKGIMDADAGARYETERRKIERMRFDSVKVGRLLPDYFFSHGEPTFYAKVVIRDENEQVQTRYFSLGAGALVMGESSKFVWFFVF